MLERILIADNSIFFCLTMQAFLEKNRLNFVGSCSKKQELEKKITKYQPDILILEYEMFYRESFELISKLKKNNNSLKIIIISSGLRKELYRPLAEEGVDSCIKKPFSETEFINVIDNVINTQ